MLAQDTLTGALYEVPDSSLSGWGEYPEVGEVPYDGLGFPIPFLGPLITGAASLLPRLFGGGGGAAPALPGIPGIPNLGNLIGRLGGLLGPGQVGQTPWHFQPSPWPFGWVRPPENFTPGFNPRRVMLRCATWAGPRGLIPQAYLNYVPPSAPGPTAMPGAPVPGALPGAFGRRRRRGFRRRR